MRYSPKTNSENVDYSEKLVRCIRDEIEKSCGWISFSRYMELALYAPELGYYAAGVVEFGAEGDFVTAPELTPLFGRTLARQAAQVLSVTGGDILELGAGSGRLALVLLRELERLGVLPKRYFILEPSPALRARQRALLEGEVPEHVARVAWLDALPARFCGLVFGNEVLDALPVHRVHRLASGLAERGVGLEGDAFVWRDRRLAAGPLLAAARAAGLEAAEPGYVTELNLAAPKLVMSLARALERGVIFFLDYGYPRAEYYHPQRRAGTLLCHYRHHSHDDPFFLPGLTDITAHVDFTAVAEAGVAAGLDCLGYTTQANFLINCGITALMQEIPVEDSAYLRQAAAVQKLLQPSEMGELVKAIALGRGVDGPLVGFAWGDRGHTLK